MAIAQVPQTVEGQPKVKAHTHAAEIHEHDHYHVSLVHEPSALGGWIHESTWHTHAHNHTQVTHGHDYPRAEEDERHGKRAHVHDHASPTHSPA